MTIAQFIIDCFRSGQMNPHRPSYMFGMGELWKFIPDTVYGPGILVNALTGSVLGVAEISDRPAFLEGINDWRVIS